MVYEKPLSHALPMPSPDPMPRVPDQPVLFQGLVNQRPLDMRLLGSLPG